MNEGKRTKNYAEMASIASFIRQLKIQLLENTVRKNEHNKGKEMVV